MTKRLSIITILCLIATWAISQERKLEIYRQGNVVYSTIVGNIDSLKFSKVLLAPSSVSVNMKETGVELTWAAVPGANYYEVYRGSSSGNTYVLVSGQISGTTYTDTFPLTGMNYYKIKAVGDNIESDLSATPAVADWRPVNASGSDTVITVSGVSFKMVAVEGGTFLMGAQSSDSSSDNYDSDAERDESPVHSVTLSDYYIGETEVTQGLWEAVMTYSGTTVTGETLTAYSEPWLGDINPSSTYGVGDNYPAYFVSYDDIVNVFLPRLNAITGKNFRLPTEAEWEYAARGGNKSKDYKYAGSNTIGDVAWYYSNSNSTTHPVGGKQANELGLYDMSGNVYEWCSDRYCSSYYSSSPTTNPTGPATGSYRMLRGGFWSHYATGGRVSHRHGYAPDTRHYNSGFRLSRSE